jgi:hypothetical protein
MNYLQATSCIQDMYAEVGRCLPVRNLTLTAGKLFRAIVAPRVAIQAIRAVPASQ